MDIKENSLEHNKSISSIKSTKSSNSASRKNSKRTSNKIDVESEDISLSQLELLANKKKLNHHEEQVSINKQSVEEIRMESIKKKSIKSSSSVSSSTSSSDSTKKKIRKEKIIQRENKNDDIRREKSELLFKFSKLNIKGKWSSLKLDMNSTLDDIKNEYERVKNEMQTERSVAFFKRMLLLGVQGVEMLNNKFDPVGVDLDGWSEAMGYSMENQEYDEVMAELYEKYKGRGQMSPEVKLIFMIISSATMFTISKKITKMDSSNAFASFIGNLVGSKNNQQVPQQQYQQQVPQQYQQQIVLENYKRDAITETTDDGMPSKMKDPDNIQDDIDLNNILNQYHLEYYAI